MAHRKGRSLLTGTGIVLGVAIFFGVLVANATTQRGVDDLIEGFTGRSDVVVGPVGSFDANLPKGTIAKLKTLPDVDSVVGEFSFFTSLVDHPSRDDPDEPTGVGVNGIVPAEAEKIQDFTFIDGAYPKPGADEVAIPNRLAEDIDLSMGDKLKVTGKAQTKPLTVVGLLDDEGGSLFGSGSQIYTSAATARRLAGEPSDVYTGAALILTDGTRTDQWIDKHRGSVPGTRFQNSETLAAGFKEFLNVFGSLLTFFAAITLFVGAFLIYLTLSMSVIERTRMYGTLRTLGASRKQVRRVVLTEAVSLGFVSTLAGLLLGLLLALGLLRLIGALFDLELPGLAVAPGAVIASVIVGMVITTISALVPAIRAGRLAPVEAMRGDYARDTKLGRAWIVGVAILALSLLLQFTVRGLGPLAVLGSLMGAVLIVPVVLRPLASLLGRVTNRLARGVGDVAVLHLSKERSRSAYTLALVMVVMAMLFATGGMYLSVREAIGNIVEQQFGADVFVNPRTPDDGTLGSKLQARDDIELVSPLRFGISTVVNKQGKKEELFINTIDPKTYFDVSGFYWEDGDEETAKAALLKGGSVLLTDEIANRFDKKVGDDFEIETAKGFHTFKVAATYVGAFGPPEIAMGLPDARKYLSTGRPLGYVAKVADGQDPEAVAKALKDDTTLNLDTETQAELKREVTTEIGGFFRIVYAILLVAAIVGLLGLANTLAMSVLHRFREIGILRAIGVTRSQTWRMVLVESATMGLAAFVLSLPLGWLLTYMVSVGAGDGFGSELPTVYPWVWIPFVLLFGVAIAVIAAIAPGRRASRLHVVTALQYE